MKYRIYIKHSRGATYSTCTGEILAGILRDIATNLGGKSDYLKWMEVKKIEETE